MKEREGDWSFKQLMQLSLVKRVVYSGALSQFVAAAWWAVFLLGSLSPVLDL